MLTRRLFCAFAVAFTLPARGQTRSSFPRIGYMALPTSKPNVRLATCLASYGANRLALVERSAIFVDRILKGASPADLPIEQASKFELVINVKAARMLGIQIPPAVLLQADKVIE